MPAKSNTADQGLQEVHRLLWARIVADGIYLRPHIRLGSIDRETAGEFFINKLGEPQIHVYRNHHSERVDDYEQELVTLAHEYGHAISHKRGERPREEMPEASPGLTLQDKMAVQDEEARAWQYGREVLLDLGLTDFAAFETRKAEADAIYLRRLSLASDD